jgi:signal transduction histidine kinase
MSIRRIILLAFVGFGAAVAVLMTTLAYFRSREALSSEIRDNLQSQAVTVMEQIDALLFERIEDLHGWGMLDVMQEAKVSDVDKRLARFLREIHDAYAGIYASINFVVGDRIVASSDATSIGDAASSGMAADSLALPSTDIVIDPPKPAQPVQVLTLRVPVADAFATGVLGELQANVDWLVVKEILDHAVLPTQRAAVLVDGRGRILAASGIPRPGPDKILPEPGNWLGPDRHSGVTSLAGWPARGDDWLVGHAASTRYQGMPDLGWRLLMLVPRAAAFAPVQRLLWTLMLVLVAVFVVAVLLAFGISGQIARPIIELTRITRRMRPDDEAQPALITSRNEVGQLAMAFNSMLADLRKSRSDLIRVSKLAAVGEMAAMLAHEVRNPLGIMRSSAQLLQRQKGIDERGHEMLVFMLKECDRINDLVTGLLQRARPRPAHYVDTELVGLVSELVERLRARAEKAGVRLELQAAAARLDFRCDPELVSQMLMNLVTNAIQMTPASGLVQVCIAAGADQIIFQVDDSGPGVAAADRELILEPFVSRRAGGVGLGLTVVQNIVSQHAGKLVIQASELGGASFRIELPRFLDGAGRR